MPAVPVTIETTNNTSVLISGLEIGQQYKFSVVAKDSTGNFMSLPSAFSATVTTSTVPFPPTNFQMYVTAIDAVSFSWTASELPAGAPTEITYTITNNRNSDTFTSSDTSCVITGFPYKGTGGTSYTFSIYATNSSGNSYYTIGDPIQVAISPTPTITSITFNSTGTQPTITFSVPYMPPHATGIRYHVKINGTPYNISSFYKQGNFFTQTTGNTITLPNNVTVAGTTYTFNVYYTEYSVDTVVINGITTRTNYSSDSPPFIIKAVGLPAVPTLLAPTAYDGYVGLTWTAASASGGTIDYYTINSYVSTLASSPVIVSCNTLNGTATSYNFSNMYGLTQGSSNYFDIRAHTEFGFSSNSSKTTGVIPGARPSIPINGEIALVNTSNSSGNSYYVFNMVWDIPNSNGRTITGYKSLATGATVNTSPFFTFPLYTGFIVNTNFITLADLDNGLITDTAYEQSIGYFSLKCRISASNSFGYSSNSAPPSRLLTRFVLSNAGTNSNVFLAKYNGSGDTLWANRIGGLSNDTVNNILEDSLGNVFVIGRYTSSNVTISSGMDLTLSAAGARDIFIVKYDSSGAASWSRKIVNNSVLYPIASVVDSNNNFITLGRFATNNLKIHTNSSNFITCSNDINYNYNRFIAKYDESGNALWSARISGSKIRSIAPSTYQEKENILTDSAGNIYVIIKTEVLNNTQPINIYNSSNTLITTFTASIYCNIFIVVQYSQSGGINWSRKIIQETVNYEGIFSYIDSSDNLYILFYANGIVRLFDSMETETYSEDAGVSSKTFCIKYDTDGNALLLPNLSLTGFVPFTNKPLFAFSQNILYLVYRNPTTISLTAYNLSTSSISWTENIALSSQYFTQNPYIAVDSTTSSVYISLFASKYESAQNNYKITIDDITYSTPQFPTNGIATVKYDVNGNVEWVRVLGDITNTGNLVNCITDSSGNVYVTAQVCNSGLKIYDSSGNIIYNVKIFYFALTTATPITLTIKYNANGTPEWYKPSIITGTVHKAIPIDTIMSPNNTIILCGTFTSSVLAL
jgi:hypothetical protein